MAKTKRELVLERLDDIEKWSAEGKTVRWIAQELGVSKTFLYDIMKQDREIEEAINDNKPDEKPKRKPRVSTKVDRTDTVDIVDSKPSGLANAIKKGRAVAVEKIESTMFMAACGFERKVKKYAKVKRVMYDNGKKAEEWEEMVEYEETQYFSPDATSAIFLLKNWAKYANEPVTNDLRRREIELKEKQAEADSW